MNAIDITQSIARRLKAAQDNNGRVAPVTSADTAFGVEAAYAVALAIHEARLAEGAVALGRKIGFTNRNIWNEYGVHQPIWGYVYDRTVVYAGTERHRCSIARYAEPKIEPEIVFHFAAAPPRGAGLGAILNSVDWVAHGFEIVQSHFPGWKFRAEDTIADSALHAMLLVGAPQPLAALGGDPIGTLETFRVMLVCNGQVRDVGKGSNVLGSPLAAVAHLIEALAKRPAYPPIAAGEIVTTGTLTAAHAVRIGETWSTRFEGIGLPGLGIDIVD